MNYRSEKLPEQAIEKMVRSLTHRGPDNSSTSMLKNACLGHTRLSIIDVSEHAHQPMESENGRFHLTYNGELYNFVELRDELISLGCLFRTNSDTEVVLASLMQWGSQAIARFNGMFAFGLWDVEKQELLLARDRFGIKPLYYEETEGGIRFGSEIKSLLACDDRSRDLNWQAMREYSFYGNEIGDESFYKGIFSLRPGRILRFSSEGFKEERYYRSPPTSFAPLTEVEAGEEVARHLRSAVHRHLVSDVPLGILLSGGIDSSAITALAAERVSRLKTYSIGFDFQRVPEELERARSIAERFNADHSEIRVSADNLPGLIGDLVRAHDQPFADAANLPLLLATEAVRGGVKVLLQGDGGDELFGGYRRYAVLSQLARWKAAARVTSLLPARLHVGSTGKRFARFADALLQPNRAMRSAMLLTVESHRRSPFRLFSSQAQRRLKEGDSFARYKEAALELKTLGDVQHMLHTDMQILLPSTFLPKVDRASMANSIEVRVPFLDVELADFVMRLPGDLKVRGSEKKSLLKKALRGTVNDEILDAPKAGFGVPVSEWLRGPLAPFLKEVLFDESIRKTRLLDSDALTECISEHESGRADNGFMLYKLLQLGLWLEGSGQNLSV